MTGGFLLRNLKVFFRSRATVFFSFLSILIIIGLYALFLGQMQVDDLKQSIPGASGADLSWLVNSWMMAGLLAVAPVTVALGALGVMVRDQDTKIIRDFLASPMKRGRIVAGYAAAAAVISAIICMAGLIVGEFYIVLSGGRFLPLVSLLEILGVTLVGVFFSVCFIFFIISFLKSQNAMSVLGTLVGTLIGFLAGAYIPMGVMPRGVQDFIMCFPPAHAGAALRQIFMRQALDKVFAGAPGDLLSQYRQMYGVDFVLNGHALSIPLMLGFIAAAGALFLVLSVWRARRMKMG